MESLCKKLNGLIPCKTQEDEQELRRLIREMIDARQDYPHNNLYYDREIYIDSGFRDAKMWEIVTKSGKVQFEPSDDPAEHPGVVARYKEQFKTGK